MKKKKINMWLFDIENVNDIIMKIFAFIYDDCYYDNDLSIIVLFGQ